jgi:hypothetical protein
LASAKQLVSAKQLLRIQLMQQCFDLSNPGMEEALLGLATKRRFAGIDPITDCIPDETTIMTFRHLLKEHELGEQIDCFAGLHRRDSERPSQAAWHGHEAGHDHRCHLDRCSQLHPYQGRRPSLAKPLEQGGEA